MDPRAYAEVRDEHFATAGRVLLAPEPVPSSEFNSKQQARQALGIEVPGRLIVSPGNQDVRKGSDVLLQAFCQAELRADDQLLIMGRCSKAVAELLAGLEGRPRRGQIIVRDQFVSDSEFCAAVMAADLVATPYRNTLRPSGVISRCIAWGVPCWGPPQGWPGWAIRRFRAGFALDLSSPGTIADSLGRALSESTRFQRSVQAAKFADFNTAENYQRLWRHLVDPIDSQPLPRPEFLEYA
jgi:hypothetical protein